MKKESVNMLLVEAFLLALITALVVILVDLFITAFKGSYTLEGDEQQKNHYKLISKFALSFVILTIMLVIIIFTDVLYYL